MTPLKPILISFAYFILSLSGNSAGTNVPLLLLLRTLNKFYSILFHSVLLYSIPFYSIVLYSILFHSVLLYSILLDEQKLSPMIGESFEKHGRK